MAYNPNQPYQYGIPDGTYSGKPSTASCYEKDGRLILDVRFMVRDPATGAWYKKDNGYNWEATKRFWLTSKDGAFNENTIKGLKEWAKGWNPAGFSDFYWFQQPDANGVPFGNLAAIGDVELNFVTDNTGSQTIWVHDPDRPRGNGRTAYVPEGAQADAATLTAKWGAKAKALFASTPKKIGAGAPQTHAGGVPAPAPAGTPAPAPTRPAPVPVRPAASDFKVEPQPWADFPQTGDGAFAYFCSKLGEPYNSGKHDERWFSIYDGAIQGKDPDQLTHQDVQGLFAAVHNAFA